MPELIPDFTTVTEVPGVKATSSELCQMFTRYKWAGEHVKDGRILELACGSGPGLGYFIKKGALEVIGSDIEERNLIHAIKHYKDHEGISFKVIDAQNILYQDAYFDLLILFEAIYYIPDVNKFLSESSRVLKPGGRLLISTVNREWPQFNPSPFSVWYPTAKVLYSKLVEHGFDVRMFGSFPDKPAGILRKIVSEIRQLAVKFHLIPDTMKGKELLKRIFYGKLSPIPYEIEDDKYDCEELVRIDPMMPQSSFTFIYADAVKPLTYQ
jgi:ubiquinone/menaquinone biosynthesis C-methylase UbiE